LIPTLAHLSSLGENTVHRANGCKINALPEQLGIDLRGRLVDELGKVERVEDARTLGVTEPSRTRRADASGLRRSGRPAASVELCATHVRNAARDPDGNQVVIALRDEGHQLSSSSSGSARPSTMCTFFWSSMIASATSNFRFTAASSLAAARSS